MSATFHSRSAAVVGRALITLFTLLASLVPSIVLTHLFTHTGSIGFSEKWTMQKGLIRPSKYQILNYRFSEPWKYVWYGVVLVCVLGMIIYILEIALMFDQNPYYYCQDETTVAWIVDFLIPYAISVTFIEPLKILIFFTFKNMMGQALSNNSEGKREIQGMSVECVPTQ